MHYLMQYVGMVNDGGSKVMKDYDMRYLEAMAALSALP